MIGNKVYLKLIARAEFCLSLFLIELRQSMHSSPDADAQTKQTRLHGVLFPFTQVVCRVLFHTLRCAFAVF